MNPSVGRIVHFFVRDYSFGADGALRPYPAIITKVHNEQLVDLVVFGGEFNGQEQTSVPLGDGDAVRSWIWPPRA